MSFRVCSLEKIVTGGANAVVLSPPLGWPAIKLLPVLAIKQSQAYFVAGLSRLGAKAHPLCHLSGMFSPSHCPSGQSLNFRHYVDCTIVSKIKGVL